MIKDLLKRFCKSEKKASDAERPSQAAGPKLPPDMEAEFLEYYEVCRPYTMTSIERMYALYSAVAYVSNHSLSGDLVECGVWKGGGAMLCAMTLQARNDARDVYLYDTFSGMSKPSEKDVDYLGNKALDTWWGEGKGSQWDMTVARLEEVRKNMELASYPSERFHFVEGKVEETIPKVAPELISVLHLDTDWYESTLHEWVHLFPRLVKGGVVIIDDYGHHKGAREATETYLRDNSVQMLLSRIDYTGRIGIKL